MKLVNERKLLKETRRYNQAAREIKAFIKALDSCTARNFPEFRKVFPTADRVGDKKVEVCIDICGNTYRLIIKNYYEEMRTSIKSF